MLDPPERRNNESERTGIHAKRINCRAGWQEIDLRRTNSLIYPTIQKKAVKIDADQIGAVDSEDLSNSRLVIHHQHAGAINMRWVAPCSA
jgi:hypothetical protein